MQWFIDNPIITLIGTITLIQIVPIKINPWTYIGKKFKHFFLGDVIQKLDKLEENDIVQCRTRILRFGDEILNNKKHTKEHFDNTLIDIDSYETYCKSHPNFKNNVTIETIDQIRRVYKKCWDDNSFL